MFYQLTFLAITFFVTGAICLGGALMRIPTHKHDIWALRTTMTAYSEGYQHHDKWLRGLEKDLARLKVDSGEGRGELQRELNIWESQHRELEARVKKIGDDLYRHFSLNMKKKGGK